MVVLDGKAWFVVLGAAWRPCSSLGFGQLCFWLSPWEPDSRCSCMGTSLQIVFICRITDIAFYPQPTLAALPLLISVCLPGWLWALTLETSHAEQCHGWVSTVQKLWMGHPGCKTNIIPDPGPVLEPSICPRQHIGFGPLECAYRWGNFAAVLHLPFFMNPVTYGDSGIFAGCCTLTRATILWVEMVPHTLSPVLLLLG